MKFKNHYFVFLFCILLGCKPTEKTNIHQIIENETNTIFEKLVNIRRDFHQHPELSGKEVKTATIIAKYLSDLGLEVKTGIANNSVIGILKGNKKGKTIAWRADMDALHNDFPDEVVFKSINNGVQHGCGHDIHMAIGLGIAEVLAKNKKSLSGTVCFIFQPEEETFVGANNLVNNNEFLKLNIDEIYALHVTAFPVGEIMVKPNEIYAYQKRIKIVMNDKFLKKDAKNLYNQIKNEILRKKNSSNPWEITNAFNTTIGLSNPETVFNDYLFMDENFVIEESSNQFCLKAYLYETNKLNLPKILPKIEQIINKSQFANSFISVSFVQENPTVINDERLTNQATKTIKSIYGKKSVSTIYGQIPYFNDDFVYFQQKIPGVYFLLGGSNSEKGIIALNHSPNFNVDENCIKVGVKSFASLILERTKSK